jgi:2-methylcitrate dehydratase PrpD
MTSVTRALAREIVATTFEDLPSAAVERLTRLFVDHIGITYMGYEAVGQALANYAADVGGPEEAVLLGTDRRVSAETAAAVNAQTSRNTDFEDTGPGLHPGPVIVHTALAVGQRARASGQEVITAMALGHELNCRFYFASLKGPDIRHANMVAATIAARLLGLDEGGTARALSLAWEFPIKEINYTRPKIPKRITAVGMGNLFSARAGVQSALLAQHGFESLEDEIDQLDDDYELNAVTDRSGAFQHAASNLFLKPWPTSHGCHHAMHLIHDFMAENDIEPADIKAIRMGLPDVYLMPHQNDAAPERYWEAIYSTAWAAAMVAHRIPPGPDWFTAERIADPACRATAAKVHIQEEPAATAAFQRLALGEVSGWVEIETLDSTWRGERTMSNTWGSPARPMPDAVFNGKFDRVVAPSLGADRASALRETLTKLTAVADLRDLQPLLMR